MERGWAGNSGTVRRCVLHECPSAEEVHRVESAVAVAAGAAGTSDALVHLTQAARGLEY